MAETRRINHEFTDDVVCPFCGTAYDGSYVYDGTRANDTTHDCDECGRTFEVERDFSVYYITRKSKEAPHA